MENQEKEWLLLPATDFEDNFLNLFSDTITEVSLRYLESDTKRGFPNTKFRQNVAHEVKITKLTYFPFQRSNGLIADAGSLAIHPGGGNRHYNPEIYFHDVIYEEGDTASNVTFVGADKKDHSIQPIVAGKNDVRVRCQCLDYHFRFVHTNDKKKAHLGSLPPPYVRKTTTRPPVNPLKVSGMCKHLFALMMRLEKDRLLT